MVCRYEAGLQKLLAAEGEVNVMKEELIQLQPKLIATGKEVEETLVVVNSQTEAAVAQKAIVQAEEAAASEKAAAAKAIKVTILSALLAVHNTAAQGVDALESYQNLTFVCVHIVIITHNIHTWHSSYDINAMSLGNNCASTGDCAVSSSGNKFASVNMTSGSVQ